MKFVVATAVGVLAVLAVAPAHAQRITGSVSMMVDTLPDPDVAPGQQPATELRTRLFADGEREFGEHLHLHASGYIAGLIADREAATTAKDLMLRPVDLYAEWSDRRFDIRAGASRVVWGRLDEFQPTDVVNPIDLTRFLLEGRNEARLAVGLVRGRVFLSGDSTLEGIVVPWFRPGRFDELDEATSPFNVSAATFGLPVVRDEPDSDWNNMQGGVRFTSTSSRIDWGVSGYRGFRSFPIVTAPVTAAGPAGLETFPRYTMLGADFETVRGPWGLRGEVAAFVDDELQASTLPRGVPGKSIDGGIGLDRRAGDYRIAANVLWSWRSADLEENLRAADEALHGSDVTLVIAADRSFARETRTVRVFAVYDPTDDTAFGRVIAAFSLRDNVWLEGSGGVFSGSSLDVVGRLSRRDFLYGRLKVFF
jgi:hypothetical protein